MSISYPVPVCINSFKDRFLTPVDKGKDEKKPGINSFKDRFLTYPPQSGHFKGGESINSFKDRFLTGNL